MNEYVFFIHDEEGFWGSLRQRGRNRREAERICRQFLENELFPNGCLNYPFRLSLQPQEKGK